MLLRSHSSVYFIVLICIEEDGFEALLPRFQWFYCFTSFVVMEMSVHGFKILTIEDDIY